ncbi:GNAT family N-acetyltransferase [Marinomonas spartinae]|uniref:GNAT family N-acetyltransferase n=1 Tax=Marinomonas spartinae TaxID=1792290 RepID=UPI0018F1C416|nr:GNAT family N-acetyltransferase [Marinomonas spartinae]MBJ7556534.1 GNAT family N-acetyltransferase [Marinomonas spartinae]
MLTFQSLSGSQLTQYIPQLAELRMRVFRDFPYLYDGDLAYEARYLKTYIEAPNSVIVLAFDSDKVVGASTGVPLRHETAEVKQPFVDAGFNIDEIFYCGESVLLPEYRGQGAGVAFFEYREAHGKALAGIKYSCFCGVQRPEGHPARPADYQPLDTFWQNRGYEKRPELMTYFSWKDMGDHEETRKPMMFWMKSLYEYF